MSRNKPLTANQIKSLHPAVRVEFKAGRLTDAQAHMANRLVRAPYRFKSRIALRVAREKVGKAGVASLQKILQAMPADAPAELLETTSFEVLGKKKTLEEAVSQVQKATAAFRHKKAAATRRPRVPPRRAS